MKQPKPGRRKFMSSPYGPVEITPSGRAVPLWLTRQRPEPGKEFRAKSQELRAFTKIAGRLGYDGVHAAEFLGADESEGDAGGVGSHLPAEAETA